MKYEFSIVLIAESFDDADAHRLYEAGCDDATIVTRNGVTRAQFDRTEASLEGAIRSAMSQIKDAGYDVARVEISASELAAG